jgi:hypothetical protein
MRSLPPLALALPAVLTLLVACADDPAPTAPTGAEQGPATLPLLPTGSHPSLVIAFEALPPAIDAAARARWDEAVAAGMRVGRVHLDWASVEPDSGQYDPAVLRDALVAMQADGLAPLVALYAVDSGGPTLPADLQARVAAGLGISAPEVLARHRALLDWAVPMIVAHGGWGLLLANEVDGHVLDGSMDVDDVARFYRHARDHAHALAPLLAVSATHTTDGPLGGAPHYAELVEELDFASFNYYPLDPATLRLIEPTAARVAADIDAFLAAAGSRPVVFQELGCPAGHADGSLLGSSPAQQQRFFAHAFAELAAEPRIRAAFVFQLVDWSPELFATMYGGVLEGEGVPQDFADRFEEWLLTTGLMTYTDGTTRPAWDTFLSAVAASP